LPGFYWTRWFIAVFTTAAARLCPEPVESNLHSLTSSIQHPFYYYLSRCQVISLKIFRLKCITRGGSPEGHCRLLYPDICMSSAVSSACWLEVNSISLLSDTRTWLRITQNYTCESNSVEEHVLIILNATQFLVSVCMMFLRTFNSSLFLNKMEGGK
jgi:hypothetical protein